ncbi:hypothetical protein [Kitasatospora sp. NPDC088134]|uniref:hypothetical protein n=1 Tax=Kitasatospora sp. NPDC088134 TaxID=3364071 RepID=UPI0038296E26
MTATRALRDLTAQLRGSGGPHSWAAAWERALAEVRPVRDREPDDVGGRLSTQWIEGTAGLALAYYLLAEAGGTPVEKVPSGAVRVLAGQLPQSRSEPGPVIGRFDTLLRRAGHLLEAPTDPVAACWRYLRADFGTPDEYDDITQAVGHWRLGPDRLRSLFVVLDRIDATS